MVIDPVGQDDIETLLENDRQWKLAEVNWRKQYQGVIMRNVHEFIGDIKTEDSGYVKTCRKEYLEIQIHALSEKIALIHQNYEDSRREQSPYWLRKAVFLTTEVDKLEKNLNRFQSELKSLVNDDSAYSDVRRIDDYMIQKARAYPIEDLVDVGKDHMILCPFHDDRNPSMYIRNNYGYCFSCQRSADVIALCMKLKGLCFVDAVRYLQMAD